MSRPLSQHATSEETLPVDAEGRFSSQSKEERDTGLYTTDSGPAKKEKTEAAQDPDLVTWDGPDDPSDPKNWSKSHKWAITAIVSAFCFISPVSSSIVAPALPAISAEFHVTNEVEQNLMFSIFVLAYAFGPLFLGPLSEEYGRPIVLQLANLFYFIFNLVCGFSSNKGEMLAFRFLAGLGGSAPLCIGAGVLSDVWRAEERGAALSIYSLAPLLGPAIGPIAGGWIAQRTTWRWIFWSTSAADALVQGLGLIFLQETYGAKLLKDKAKKLRKETGNGRLKTAFDHPDQQLIAKLRHSTVRPFVLLSTQPMVQVLALYMAYLYGIMYLVLGSFSALWIAKYHESVGVSGINYVSVGLGCFLGAQFAALVTNRIYIRLKTKNNGVGRPEFRLPLMVPGSLLVPIGLFWYGWSAEATVHWIMPNIGICIYAIGGILGFQCIQVFLVDAYTQYAASAIAAAAFLRSLAAFGFPLFAPYMYKAMGDGWANSMLGFIAIAIGLPSPLLLWKYGPMLRERSPYAAGGDR